MPKPMRVRAKEAYVEFAKLGRPLSITSFSSRSAEVLGEHVTYQTAITWYKQDGWATAVSIVSFDVSEELRRTKILLDIAYNAIVFADEDTSSKDFAEAARMYKTLIQKLPSSVIAIVEDDIVAIREILYLYITGHEKSENKSVLARISSVWVDLEKRLVPELPIDDIGPTVEADSFIFRQRKSGS